jgi:hypothetical protein
VGRLAVLIRLEPSLKFAEHLPLKFAEHSAEVFFDGIIDHITLCNPLHVSPIASNFTCEAIKST